MQTAKAYLETLYQRILCDKWTKEPTDYAKSQLVLSVLTKEW